MLRQETGPARRAMQALLKGRLAFTPQERDGERFYTFEGEGTISPVIAGAAGVQRVWWPQGIWHTGVLLRRVTYLPFEGWASARQHRSGAARCSHGGVYGKHP